MAVTKEQFEAFVKVQKSGVCNMWSSQVEVLAGISKETHLEIIEHYEELEAQYRGSTNEDD